jgi:type IV secretory pathway VirB9-like protein
MNINKLLIFITFAAFPSVYANAGEQEKPCRVIDYHSSAPIKIYTALYSHVMITLPDVIDGEPISPNPLWKVQGAGNYLFIAPTNADKLGLKTTVSAITKTGSAYSFIVEQNDKKFNSCVNITESKFMSTDQAKRLGKRNVTSAGRDYSAEVTSLKRQLALVVNNAKEEKDEAVKQAIRKYRYHTYTRYKWKGKSKKESFIDTNFISDVWDDGRFTYLRLTNDNKALPVVEAQINGEPEFIEAKYDELADLYRVVGIFPGLALIYGDDRIDISRLDKTTRGEF